MSVRAPNVAENVQIYGLLYNVDDGSLREVVRGKAPESLRKKTEVGHKPHSSTVVPSPCILPQYGCCCSIALLLHC